MPKSTVNKEFYLDLQNSIENKELEISTIEKADDFTYSLGNAN